MSRNTFQDLGLTFPLFEASIECTSDFVGNENCSICESEAPCFRGGIGVDIDIRCKNCGTVNVERGNEVVAGARSCKNCNAPLKISTGPEGDPVICYDCLRAGRATITKDTEFGMVRREDAALGRTHGAPGLDTEMVETVPTREDGWTATAIPPEYLNELIRTPGYTSWQGDIWLFCCARPMIFIGEWTIDDFKRHATDGDAGALVAEMSHPDEAKDWHGQFPDWGPQFYVFRCATCGKKRAHNDFD